MSNGMALVETIDLTRQYKRGRIPIPALSGIDIKVGTGEIVGIIGPSGSGKTTLLNLLGGLDRPTSGKVIVDKVELNEMSDKDLTDYRLFRIGFIFQFYNLISTLSAEENVEIPMMLAGVKSKAERQERAMELLKIVGLEGRRDHKPDELSGGEQQRVAVARALANNPAVILADEPTGDLDSRSAKILMDLVKDIQRQRKATFVLVTHDPLVLSKCDRAYAMRDGKVTHELSGENIAKSVDESKLNMMDGMMF